MGLLPRAPRRSVLEVNWWKPEGPLKKDDVLEMQLQDLDALSVRDWIEKAKAVIKKIEDEFDYKVKTLAVTVSANPSATVTFEKK